MRFWRRRLDPRRADEGFTLVEVVVAMFIVAVTVSASVGVVVRTNQSATDSKARVFASGIASGYIETARAQTSEALAVQALADQRDADNRVYHVTRTLTTFNGSVAATCDPTAATSPTFSSVLVTYTVTWDNMAPNTKPVRADTLINGVASGAVAVSVTGASGQPISGATVTLSNGSTTLTAPVTQAPGCAIFVVPSSLPGPWTATATKPGNVTTNGTSTARSSGDVVNNQVTNLQVSLDLPVSVNVQYVNNTGTVNVPQSTIPPDFRTGQALNQSGVSGTATLSGSFSNLWPSSYSISSGPDNTCALGRADMSAGSTAPTPTVRVPTGTVTVSGFSTFTGIGPITAIETGQGNACPYGTEVPIGQAFLFFNNTTASLPLGNWQMKIPTNVLSAIPLFTTVLDLLGQPGLAYICVDAPLSSSSSGLLFNLVDLVSGLLTSALSLFTNGGCRV